MSLFRRFRWWLGRRDEEAALAAEIAFHQELKQRELAASGLSAEAAAVAARRAMGNTTYMREESRAVWLLPWLERLGQDIRFSLRSARKNPAFAVGVIAISALGIGATTAIFSVVDAVILRPLPYPAADRLVYFDWGSHSPPRFRDWQREITSIEQWAAAWGESADLVGGGRPERLHTTRISADFFAMFGARPAIGRFFSAPEFAGAGQVAVLSDGLWRRRFAADSSVLGTTIEVGGRRLQVIGVVDQGFIEPEQISRPGTGAGTQRPSTDVWTPLALSAEIAEDPRYSILAIAGRLRPGTTMEGFRQELVVASKRLAAANPRVHGDGEGGAFSIPVLPLQKAIVGDSERALATLLVAVGLMLLIACANVTNLYLARSTDRHRELAVRAALGAGRGRLVRQLVTESATLGIVAGVVGVGVALVGVRALAATFPGNLPRAGEIAVDGRVLLFALAVATLTGLIFGLVPAWSLREQQAFDAIKAGGGSGGKSGRLRAGLVVAEIALALVLLVGSGLLFHSFLQIVRVDPGFDPSGLTMARLELGEPFTSERRLTFARALGERLGEAPGVASVAVGVAGPMGRTGRSRCCWAHDKVVLAGGQEVLERVLIHPVGPKYFATIGARIVGAEFAPGEGFAAPFPTVVSDRLAGKLFGAADPIGKQFSVGGNSFVIRGVVTALHQWGLDQETESELFVPYSQFGGDFDLLNVVVRAATPGAPMESVIREAVADLAPTLPADDIAPMSSLIDASLAGPRFYGLLMGTFGALALVLAAAGIYASMLYAVRQRTRELGIRVALGAKARDIAQMVVGDAGKLAIAGLALGSVGAIGLAKALRAFLFGIEPSDPVAFAGAVIVLGATVLAAAYWPARRAGRADPLDVLRAE